MSLEIGSAAPEFNLKDQHGADISLSSFKGSKNVVITFYPFAFSGLCTGELCGLRDDLGAFQNDLNAITFFGHDGGIGSLNVQLVLRFRLRCGLWIENHE